MNSALITTKSKEERKKQELLGLLERKQKFLEKIVAKTEILKEELSIIEHEYSVRIGALLEKDNELDLQIMRQKKINTHVDNGLTLDEAIKKEETAFYNDMFSGEEDNPSKESLIVGKQISRKKLQEIRMLWKKLIVKFHPDLILDPTEKAEREELTKKINKAYREHDLNALKTLEKDLHGDNVKEFSIEKIEEMVIEVVNMIAKVEKEYQRLRNSEWFVWKNKIKKAKAKKEDVFLDLEKNLIDSILQKIAILKKIHPNFVQ